MSGKYDTQTTVFHWSLIFISGSAGVINISVLRMFMKFRKNLLTKSAHNRILYSLCIADLLVGIFGTTLGALLINGSSAKTYKLAGNVPLFSFMFASVLSLALLTADRLLAIKRPFMYGTSAYLSVINKLIFAIWCVPLYLTLQETLIFLHVSSGKELKVRSMFFVVFFCIAFVSLFATNSMLYLSIKSYAARRKARNDPSNRKISYDDVENPSRNAKANDINLTEDPMTDGAPRSPKVVKVGTTSLERELRQTSFLCIVIVVAFLVLWTPLGVYRLFYAVGSSFKSAWLRRLCLCLTVSNSLLNPVIYLAFRKRLRAYFTRQFKFSLGIGTSVGLV